jgi:hypothetical protein
MIDEVEPRSLVLSARAIQIARTQLFVREKTGHNDGAEVEAYLKSVKLGAGYAWCQAFVYWCFQQAAVALGTKNPLTQTAGVLDHWHRTTGEKVTHDRVGPGDIFIMDFGKGLGHTGIVSEVRLGTINRVTTIEGNTNIAGGREGSGVYERLREIKTITGFIRY